jgi:hypothetical protein
MIIDGHVHAAGKFSSPTTLVQALDELGVDKLASLGIQSLGTDHVFLGLTRLLGIWQAACRESTIWISPRQIKI